MDELRDYRFYADDMVHLSSTGIEFVWEKFSSLYFSSSVTAFQKEYSAIRNAMNHRPFQPESEGYYNFLQRNLDCLERLSQKYPQIVFEEERAFFTAGLARFCSR